MRFHHLGCLVNRIEEAIEQYRQMHGQNLVASNMYTIKDQQVRVCFLNITENMLLEFVEVDEENKTLGRMMRKGITFYHLGYKVIKIDESINRLLNDGYRLVNSFNSEAFEGKKCAFLISPQQHLIELIQA